MFYVFQCVSVAVFEFRCVFKSLGMCSCVFVLSLS